MEIACAWWDALGGGCDNYVFLGEAGCGKSEAALNLALALAESGERQVHFFDLDMTKPLFRSRERRGLLEAAGVSVHFEEQFMDAPTQAGGVVRLLRDRGVRTVLDVGGDYIGARAIGGYAGLLNSAHTAVCYLINPFRPWSATLEHIDRVLGETLGVSHIALERLHLIGNPNLGAETTAEDVEEGARRLAELVGPYKPVELLCVRRELCPALPEELPCPVVPLRLYMSWEWEEQGPAVDA